MLELDTRHPTIATTSRHAGPAPWRRLRALLVAGLGLSLVLGAGCATSSPASGERSGGDASTGPRVRTDGGPGGGSGDGDVSASHCRDGSRSGDESDVDCGGSCGGCGVGASCEGNADCASDICYEGRCACPTGRADCNGDPADGCEADLSSPETCGSCSDACDAARPLCTGEGSRYWCVSECPPERPEECDGSCVDTTTDPSHCGSCGFGCDEGELCSVGMCGSECEEGEMACEGACVDASSSDEHCGDCGEACASAEYCEGGSCRFDDSVLSDTYCPSDALTRAQAAVFIVRLMHGADYEPPSATGRFDDVPPSSPHADYIEQLARDGITDGCDENLFCPSDELTRAQASVFFVRANHGADYTPPDATGIFDDVPADSLFAPFIEQLARDGVTDGCRENEYCPDSALTRAQTAIFLVRIKHGADHRPEPAEGYFSDVSASSPAAPYIEHIARDGITQGC